MLHWYDQTDAGMRYKHAADLSYMHLAEKDNDQDSALQSPLLFFPRRASSLFYTDDAVNVL
jgi:hypothetical protein